MKMVLWFEQKGAMNDPSGLKVRLKDACLIEFEEIEDLRDSIERRSG